MEAWLWGGGGCEKFVPPQFNLFPEFSMAKDRVATANQLRWLGEEADGKRDGEYVVVWKKSSGFTKLGLAPRGNPDGDEPARDIPVKTEFEGPGLRGEARIQVLYDGKPVDLARDDGSVPDCIFVTQSAFDKFVIPYYTRFKHLPEIST